MCNAWVILRPSKLVQTLGFPLVCLAIFSLGGGHWAVLQSLAWSQMMWKYVQNDVPVVVAVEKTFSGENPCALCTKVKKGRQQEQKAPWTLSAAKKVDAFLMEFSGYFPPQIPVDFVYFHAGNTDHSARRDAPPGPVPRSVLV